MSDDPATDERTADVHPTPGTTTAYARPALAAAYGARSVRRETFEVSRDRYDAVSDLDERTAGTAGSVRSADRPGVPGSLLERGNAAGNALLTAVAAPNFRKNKFARTNC
jgi:hypothetical protein